MRRFEQLENHQFTYKYAQPEDYRFCQDSVIFAKYIAGEVGQVNPGYRALDVCAGCGIIGFEIGHYLPDLLHVDFMEIQEEFRPSFLENLALTERGSGREFRFLNESFLELSTDRYAAAYDLIVGNPPYFMRGEGLLSPSQMRNRCRFFLDGDLVSLVSGVVNALKPQGVGYLLMKSGSEHGRRAFRDLQLHFNGKAQLSVCANIRGTDVIQILRFD